MATSTKHEHSALRLKNDGNALFAECKFREAVACYMEGLLLTEGGEGEDLDLRAVLLSNRSGAYYEMGDYGKRLASCYGIITFVILNVNADDHHILCPYYNIICTLRLLNRKIIRRWQGLLYSPDGDRGQKVGDRTRGGRRNSSPHLATLALEEFVAHRSIAPLQRQLESWRDPFRSQFPRKRIRGRQCILHQGFGDAGTSHVLPKYHQQ